MISDGDLYRLAIFLGSASMILIVLYHFLEVNASPVAHKVEGGKVAASKKQATN
ncbi:hypothetical protein QQX98_007938 [Neonectria punicea]|uniref:Dolichyl-diphosphooligosaccharide--protein glycosyltransferase subunit 4 n=1 Tax=Neonectria punicea TaxID=979145 RepID=A0ABR1GWK9_9HYPO